MEEDVTKGQSTGSPSKGLSIMNYKQSLPSIPASSSGGISGSSKVAPKSLDSVYTEMLVSLNKTIEGGGCRVERFEIAFPDSSPSSRDLLGRKGHVAMVEDPHVLELLLVANRLHL